jgi:thermitase
MRRTTVALAIAVLLLSSFPTIVFAAPPSNPAPVSDFSSQQILVKFKPGTGLPEATRIHRRLGGQVKETIPGIGVQVVTVPTGRAKEKVKAYSSDVRVTYAEPDFVAETLGSPDDPLFGSQWAMVKVQAPQAWEVTTGSASINIAILDTGVDLDHPDLANKIISNINFSGSPTVDDVHGHGTHVAGIAAAMTDNGIGVAGLGYSAAIMNVKVMGDSGTGTYSAIASGIIWAADNGADVINLSLGGSSGSSILEDAVNYAWGKGVVVVAAAGNGGSTAPMYPACYADCMAVAATDAIDGKASWSNYGDWVDVAAPGVIIYSTLKDNSYGYKSGTSMASPHVAGLAALVFATVHDANGDGKLNDEVRSRIEANCDDIGLYGVGHGRINAARAVGDVAPVPPGSISGKVTDAEDGTSIVGATVTDGTRTVLTDAAGQYGIDDVPPGTYQVIATKAGYEPVSLTVDVLSEAMVVADFSLNGIIVPGNITGMVTDGEGGAPVVGATVTDGTRMTTTDATGGYTLANVPPGTYELTAAKSGYQSSSLTVDVLPGSNAVANFSLSQIIIPGSITGSVTDPEDGSHVVGATVSDGTRIALTDGVGTYSINNVPPGTYHIVASKEGYQSSFLTVTVPSGTAAVADVLLHEAAVLVSITGTVTDARDASPIVGAIVSDGTRTMTADGAGKYTIADVPPGTYQVTASQVGYENVTSSVAVVSGGIALVNFALNQKPPAAGAMWVDSIRFIKSAKSLLIEVKIVTGSGALAGARVGLSLERSSGNVWHFSGTADINGLVRFRVSRAPVGSYLATVTSLTRSGFTWDTSQGIISATYAIGV